MGAARKLTWRFNNKRKRKVYKSAFASRFKFHSDGEILMVKQVYISLDIEI